MNSKKQVHPARKFLIVPITLGLVLFLFSGCQKESMTSEEDGADLVEYAFSKEAAGFSEQSSAAAELAMTYLGYCDYEGDSSLNYVSPAGARISYDYAFSWNWSVECTGSLPTAFNFDFSSDGNYTAPRMISDDNSVAELRLTQLMGNDDFLLNGSYQRSGSQEARIRDKQSFSSQLDMTLTDLGLDKSSFEITGGTADFVLSGSTQNGGNFNMSGTLTFLGNQLVELEINGNTYTFSL